MALPEDVWVHEVSTTYPDATLRLLTGVPKGDRALELGEVRAANPGPVAGAVRSHPDIVDYDQVFAGDERVLAQYEADEVLQPAKTRVPSVPRRAVSAGRGT